MNAINQTLDALELKEIQPSAVDPQLVEFTVLYTQDGSPVLFWECHAEDTSHAIEQLLNAEPTDDIRVLLAMPTELYNALEPKDAD